MNNCPTCNSEELINVRSLTDKNDIYRCANCGAKIDVEIQIQTEETEIVEDIVKPKERLWQKYMFWKTK